MSKAGLVVLEQAFTTKSDSWLGDSSNVDFAGLDKH